MSDYKRTRDVIRVVEERMASPCMQDPLQQGACRSIWWAINELPSADVVERKRGHWVEDATYGRGALNIERFVRCSECGYVPRYKGEPIIPTINTMLFCPNCGADMRERKDNEID